MIAENELKAKVLKLEGELEVREVIIVCSSALIWFASSVYKYSLKRITGLSPCVLLSVKTIVVLHITFPLICLLLCNKWDVFELHNSPVSEIYTDGEFWVLVLELYSDPPCFLSRWPSAWWEGVTHVSSGMRFTNWRVTWSAKRERWPSWRRKWARRGKPMRR